MNYEIKNNLNIELIVSYKKEYKSNKLNDNFFQNFYFYFQ